MAYEDRGHPYITYAVVQGCFESKSKCSQSQRSAVKVKVYAGVGDTSTIQGPHSERNLKISPKTIISSPTYDTLR